MYPPEPCVATWTRNGGVGLAVGLRRCLGGLGVGEAGGEASTMDGGKRGIRGREGSREDRGARVSLAGATWSEAGGRSTTDLCRVSRPRVLVRLRSDSVMGRPCFGAQGVHRSATVVPTRWHLLVPTRVDDAVGMCLHRCFPGDLDAGGDRTDGSVKPRRLRWWNGRVSARQVAFVASVLDKGPCVVPGKRIKRRPSMRTRPCRILSITRQGQPREPAHGRRDNDKGDAL